MKCRWNRGWPFSAFYDELAAAFGLTIDATGPNFGTEPLLDTIADSSALAKPGGTPIRVKGPGPGYVSSLADQIASSPPGMHTTMNPLGPVTVHAS